MVAAVTSLEKDEDIADVKSQIFSLTGAAVKAGNDVGFVSLLQNKLLTKKVEPILCITTNK